VPVPAEPLAADTLARRHRRHQQELPVPAGVLRIGSGHIDELGQQALNQTPN
jgi:hypothetical protein